MVSLAELDGPTFRPASEQRIINPHIFIWLDGAPGRT